MPLPRGHTDGPWVVLSDDGNTRKWLRQDPDVPNQWIVRTQTYVTSAVAEDNARLRNETHGKRFGEMPLVARIPMHELYNKNTALGQAWKAGDEDWMRKYLNASENLRHRTREGRI